MTKKKWEWLDRPITWRGFIKFDAMFCAICTALTAIYMICAWWNTRSLFAPVKSVPTEEFDFETEE